MLQTAPPPNPVLKRLPQLLVVLAIGSALTLAAIGPRVVGGTSAPPPSTIVAERTLAFHDNADKDVVVTEDGHQVALFQGEQGFIRGILRTMARTRRGEGLDFTQPFRLTAWANGRITLDDVATGSRVELEAFGPTNANVFASLLPIAPRPVPDYYK